jgi:histidine triad (HIT) family protein
MIWGWCGALAYGGAAGEKGMDGCIFCKMVGGEIPATKVYEDEAVLAFLDIGPISDGHTLVIPKEHCANLHECSPDVLAAVSARLGKVAEAVASEMDADGYNVLSNNGAAAGQVVDHLHFHIIPRKVGDRVFTQWPSYKYNKGQMEDIAAKIRRRLT